jgi:hypothetical protein
VNLFVAGWGRSADVAARAWDALRRAATRYPQLDPGTAWKAGAGPGWVAAVQHPPRVAAPRVYTVHDPRRVVLYDGCPVPLREGVVAHDAGSIAAHWDELPDVLDGQYAAVRLDLDQPRLTLVVDPFGLEQVYHARAADAWLVSNSAQLLAEVGDRGEVDRLAAALCVGTGTVGADRTWHEGVRAVPGGEVWTWDERRDAPVQVRHYSLEQVVAQHRRPRPDDAEVVHALDGLVAPLVHGFGPLECSLSGGRDSRLVAQLLVRARADVTYFTLGDRGSADARVASALARTAGLRHESRPADTAAIAADWDSVSARVAGQCDGLVSLRHAQLAAEQPRELAALGVTFWGAAGAGVAKGNRLRMRLVAASLPAVTDELVRRWLENPGGLLRPEGHTLARDYAVRRLREAADAGVAPADTTAIFAMVERSHRWEYAVARLYRPATDVFSPLVTRAFVHAALAYPPWARLRWVPHRRWIRAAGTPLARVPFDRPWPARVPGTGPAVTAGRKLAARVRGPAAGAGPSWRLVERAAIVEAVREHVRATCLDQPSSPIWDVVDRRAFEHLMSDEGTAARRRHVDAVFDLAAGFAYLAQLDAAPSPR